ncbi:MAG TPA: alpha-2-macroglobulin [Hyphomonadaceae bacterium]|nr:alpha-2-macroglobulin [Hyphomonadaceae bacterium]HPN06530.1 alpha-2-macroglobulin [Hyphomonadaceae bacterium]
MGTNNIWRGLSLAAAGIVAAIALQACGGPGKGSDAAVVIGKDQGPQLETRKADAARAGAGSKEFEFVRYSIDVTKDLPRACLTFSSTLNPSTDYRPFLDMGRGPQIALQTEGANLCLGGLTFGTDREVKIRSGLPANDGRTLAFDETVGISFGDRPAYVGFKGDGVILPRIDADGLGLETVNVDKVKVTISRITDRALAFKTISQGYSHSQGGWGYMDYNSDVYDVAEPVWTGELDTPASPNTAKTTVFPIAKAVPKLKPGAYFVELDQLSASSEVPNNAAKAKRWLVITDLALTTYTGNDGMSATVRSLQSAKPVSGVKLELVARNNEILARGDSDGSGRVNFSGPIMRGEGNVSPRMLMAYAPNGDFAILDLDRSPVDLTERDIGGRAPAQAADAFVYTERGVYRPGEKVFITSLIRDAAANAANNRPGSVIVYGPNGLEAGRVRFKDAKKTNGAITYEFDVPRTAARGNWRISTEVDGVGVIGGQSFSVEDFVPQRIALDLTADDKTPMRANETRPITANVRFLYGAPGADLPVEGNVRVETDQNPFPDLKGFVFGRHNEEFRESTFDLASQNTDSTGKAIISLDPHAAENATSSRPLRLRAVVSAIEPGGRAVRDDVRVSYRPEARYVGVKPAFDDRSSKEGEAASFEVVSVDRLGALKAATINWRLVRIDWKYDWYRADGGEWQWRQSRRVVELETGNLKIGEGQRGSLKTRALDYGDFELYLTEEANGGEASYAFWSGWGGQPVDGVEAPDRVRVQVPDALPAIGNDVDVTIVAPYAGEAEIVVASENVITSRTITVKANEGTRVKLPVTKAWGAGAYVMATVYTPRDAVKTPKPRRAVGVAHIAVDTKPRTFALELTAPAVQRPNTKMTVNIAAKGPSDDAYVQLMAVDEGILLLTGFKSPDPVDYFFGKRRLGVELRDDYGRLLDPNQGAAGNIRQGGDQIGGAGLTVVPTQSVVMVSAPVKLSGGKAAITFDVPAFNGELRLMAVAWSNVGVGGASKPVTVRDQVPALMALPRFLAPGDTATATLTLDNVEGAAGAYNAAIQATAPVRAVTGNLSANLNKGQRSDIDATFSAAAEGISNVSFNVSGPSNYSVQRSYPIQTRSAWMPASYVRRTTIPAGGTFAPDAGSLSSFVPGSGYVQVSFSPIPMDAAALYDSLDQYPYGCTEQITSRALPLLYANQIAALAGRKTPGDMKAQIQEAISTLLNRQGADGAIGLWRTGDALSTPWLGAYATDFLFRAKAAGFVVPDAALDKAYDALEEFAVRENRYSSSYDFEVYESRYTNDTEQKLMDRSVAYAAYVLAKAGRMDKSRLRYLHDDRLSRIADPLAKAQIAAALYMIGDNARSKSAFDQAEAAIGYTNTGDWYQTSRRDLAGVLALAQEAKQTDRVRRLSQRVAQDLPEPDRLTTQEKAFLLLAANALSGGQAAVNVAVQGQADTLSSGVYKMRDVQTPPVFTNRGQGQLWVTAMSRGSPASAPPPAADGMTALKQLWTPGGQAIDGTSFRQGDRLIVAITVGGSEMRKVPVVVADLLPAGFEIEAVLRPEDAGANGPYRFLGTVLAPNIAEARDDRFVAAFDLFDQKRETVAYMVRVVTPGTFTMPGVVAEDMYKPDTYARTISRTVTVAKR